MIDWKEYGPIYTVAPGIKKIDEFGEGENMVSWIKDTKGGVVEGDGYYFFKDDAGDFYKMEMEFKEVLSKVLIRKWIQPQLVVSLSGCSEGGYTNIENRAFLEAAYGASNAINVIISDKVISTKQAIELLSA